MEHNGPRSDKESDPRRDESPDNHILTGPSPADLVTDGGQHAATADLEDCEAVAHVDARYNDAAATHMLDVTVAYGNEDLQAITPVLAAHDLAIWTVNFEHQRLTLVPQANFEHDYGSERPSREQTPRLEDALERVDAVERTSVGVAERPPRLRVGVALAYGTRSLAPLADVLATYDLAVRTVDFRRTIVDLVARETLTYQAATEVSA